MIPIRVITEMDFVSHVQLLDISACFSLSANVLGNGMHSRLLQSIERKKKCLDANPPKDDKDSGKSTKNSMDSEELNYKRVRSAQQVTGFKSNRTLFE